MRCGLCVQRKAKRFCPARSEQICPQCCGEKRVLEIDCPETCVYLKAGRERDSPDYLRHLRGMDAATQEKAGRVLQSHEDVIARLEYAIGRERLLSRDLTDRDVVEAVDALLETYGTEEKGILYEKCLDDLRIESLRKQLREVVESFRNPGGEQNNGLVDLRNTRLSLRAAIECLEFLRSMAEAYIEDRRAARGYVDFLARMVPSEKRRGSLIVL